MRLSNQIKSNLLRVRYTDSVYTSQQAIIYMYIKTKISKLHHLAVTIIITNITTGLVI